MDTLRENSDKTWEEVEVVEEEQRFSKQHKKVYAATPKTINEHKTKNRTQIEVRSCKTQNWISCKIDVFDYLELYGTVVCYLLKTVNHF